MEERKEESSLEIEGYEDSKVYMESSTEIECPLEVVWSVLLDFDNYKEWSSFTPEVKLNKDAKIGSEFTMNVKMDPKNESLREQKLTFQGIDEEKHTICWTAQVSFLLSSKRLQKIQKIGNEKTLYQTKEAFSGILKYVIDSFFITTLKERFSDIANDLKKYCEKKYKEMRDSSK